MEYNRRKEDRNPPPKWWQYLILILCVPFAIVFIAISMIIDEFDY